MTREQYLSMREKGNFNIVHEFYKEKFDPKKHTPFLSIMDLPNLLLAAGRSIDKIYEDCCRHYDEKFDVRILSDKNGNVIKIL
jgi:hypothetical protein